MGRVLRLSGRTIGALGLTFVTGFIAFVVTVWSYDVKAPVAGDAVVVLTGGDQRVREGFRLFTGGAGRRILISGVNRTTTKGDLQRLSGVTPLLFDCCVDIDYAARDTIGNAAGTRAWLETWGFRRLIVVTSNYHMPRSLLELARTLPGVELVPHPVVSHKYQSHEWWRHAGTFRLVLTEYVKVWFSAGRLAVARLHGHSRPVVLPEPAPSSLSPSLPRITGL